MIKFIFKNYILKFFFNLISTIWFVQTYTYNIIIIISTFVGISYIFLNMNLFCFIQLKHCALHFFESM